MYVAKEKGVIANSYEQLIIQKILRYKASAASDALIDC